MNFFVVCHQTKAEVALKERRRETRELVKERQYTTVQAAEEKGFECEREGAGSSPQKKTERQKSRQSRETDIWQKDNGQDDRKETQKERQTPPSHPTKNALLLTNGKNLSETSNAHSIEEN